MEFFLITILLLFILVVVGLIFWLIKIIKFYKQNRTKIATINATILGLLIVIVCWELRIISLSADVDFKNQTRDLTGKKFWCWNEYRYIDDGIGGYIKYDNSGKEGEGFTFEIYKLNDEIAKYFINPDKDFFEHFPSRKFETTTWKKTPVLDTDFVNYVTPVYGNWSQSLQREIETKQKIVKEIARNKGSYYAIRHINGNDLYLISPKQKLIIYISHNM